MMTLTVELPVQTAAKFAQLEQQHGERLQQVLERLVLRVLEKVEEAPDTELRVLEETLVISEMEDDLEFDAIINYLMDKNAELYRRLA